MNLLKSTILLATAAITATPVLSQFSGNEDPTFGSDGNLWYNYFGGDATSVITKLVLDENSESFYFSGALNTGGFNAMVVKASMDGELEPTLTEGTISYDPYIGLDDRFESVAVQSNGKVVAVGYSLMGPENSDVIIARFNTDGAFDPTFNEGVPITFDEGGLDFATDVAIQEDGKIIIIGSYQVAVDDLDLFIIRLNSDGTPDGTFGMGGVQILDTYTGFEMITSITILESGKIMAVGNAGPDVLMVQLDVDGNFDTEFGGDGTINFKVNELPSSANKVVELGDGDLLLSGNNESDEDGFNGFVVKMGPTGDFAFDFSGIDGILALELEDEIGLDTSFVLQDMEVLENGQILIVGDYETDVQNIALILVNTDGELDTDFGDEGVRQYNLSGGSLPNVNAQIEVSSTGSVFMSANVINGPFEDIVTVRLIGDMAGVFDGDQISVAISAYPNPTANNLNVSIDSDESQEIAVSILDISGRTLAILTNQFITAGQNTLSLTNEFSALPAGTYWVNVKTDNGNETIPVVKY